MDDERIEKEIDEIAARRLLWLLGRWLVLVIVCALLLGLIIGLTHGAVRVSLAFAVSGMLFGVIGPRLPIPESHRSAFRAGLLALCVVVFVLVIALRMYRHTPIPGRLILAPGFFAAGYLLAERRLSRH